jgi:2-dehydropantoate 2-reductase
VVREIFQVLAASGHCTHWPDAESYLEVFYRDLLPPTYAHESSMLLDLRSGNRSEIDVLSGAVAALARKHGVDAPANTALADLIRAIDAPASSVP